MCPSAQAVRTRSPWMLRASCSCIGNPLEGRNPGLGAPEDQRVNVVGPLVRVHRLEVHAVADEVVFDRDATGAVPVARYAGNLQCTPAGVPLQERNNIRTRSSRVS